MCDLEMQKKIPEYPARRVPILFHWREDKMSVRD